MAKAGKKSSAKKPAAKQLGPFPLSPEQAKGVARLKAETKDYWATQPKVDWTDRSITRYLAKRDLPPRVRAEEAAPKKEKSIPKDPKKWLALVPTRFPTGGTEKRDVYFKRLAGYMKAELGDNAWEASTIRARMYEDGLLPLRQKHPKKSHRKSH